MYIGRRAVCAQNHEIDQVRKTGGLIFGRSPCIGGFLPGKVIPRAGPVDAAPVILTEPGAHIYAYRQARTSGMYLLHCTGHKIVNHLATEGKPLDFKGIRRLVQENMSGFRKDGPALRFPANVLGELFVRFFRIAGVQGIVVIAATVHHDTVQTFISGQVFQHGEEKILHVRVGRVQEAGAQRGSILRMVQQLSVGRAVHRAPGLEFRLLVHHAMLNTRRFPAADHNITPACTLRPALCPASIKACR